MRLNLNIYLFAVLLVGSLGSSDVLAQSTNEQLSFLGASNGMAPQQVEQAIQKKCDRVVKTTFTVGDTTESVQEFILGDAYMKCQHVPFFDTTVAIQFFFNDNKLIYTYVHNFEKGTVSYPPDFFTALTQKYKVSPKAQVTPIPNDPQKSANFRIEFAGKNQDQFVLIGISGYMYNQLISTGMSLFLQSGEADAIHEKRSNLVEEMVNSKKRQDQNSARGRL